MVDDFTADAEAAREEVAEFRVVAAAIKGALWAAEHAQERMIGEGGDEMSLAVDRLDALALELTEAADSNMRWLS